VNSTWAWAGSPEPDPIRPVQTMRRKAAMRTILHGTCLLSGVHPVGSEEWKTCPLRRAQARADRSRKAAEARWRAGPPGNYTVTKAMLIGAIVRLGQRCAPTTTRHGYANRFGNPSGQGRNHDRFA
jgi:hypothetical protein